jgi:hypothetical protein
MFLKEECSRGEAWREQNLFVNEKCSQVTAN